MPRFSANVTFLYRELPLVERFAAARHDGFTAVEILSPENMPIAVLANAVESAGVNVVLCNAPMGDFLTGGPGLSGVPGRQADFAQAIQQALDLALALNCPRIHVGPSRIPASATEQQCADVLSENLSLAADLVSAYDKQVLIEPMNTNDAPDACLSTVCDALKILDSIDKSNAELQFDIYHMAQMEADVLEAIENNIEKIGHFQFADFPGRHEPGSGELDFKSIFGLIDQHGYQGYLGAEYQPSDVTSDSLAWFDEFRVQQ